MEATRKKKSYERKGIKKKLKWGKTQDRKEQALLKSL
jgi:hypothetical protein